MSYPEGKIMDSLLAEITKLQAENKELREALIGLTNDYADDIAVRLENSVLKEQSNSFYHQIAKAKALILSTDKTKNL